MLGVSIDKEFMPSVANTIGTDLRKYNVIRKNRFAFNPMHVGRDERLPIACYARTTPALVSPAYFMFEVIDTKEVLPEYLVLLFKTDIFDHLCWFHSDASVRGGLTWDDFCDIDINIPDVSQQVKFIDECSSIQGRIEELRKSNEELEHMARLLLLDEISENGEAKEANGKFADLIVEDSGGDWGKEKATGNYKEPVICVRGADIPDLNVGTVSSAPVRYILKKNYESRIIAPDNLIVEMSGGSPVQSTGRIAIVTERCRDFKYP